jgi:hypothetical protein
LRKSKNVLPQKLIEFNKEIETTSDIWHLELPGEDYKDFKYIQTHLNLSMEEEISTK